MFNHWFNEDKETVSDSPGEVLRGCVLVAMIISGCALQLPFMHMVSHERPLYEAMTAWFCISTIALLVILAEVGICALDRKVTGFWSDDRKPWFRDAKIIAALSISQMLLAVMVLMIAS
jgi:hypothetical protein